MPPEHPITPETFLELSADLSYRLSGRAFDPRTLLHLILEGAVQIPCAEDLLVRAVSAVRAGYGDDRRKMGPLAVVHPLRVAAILSRVTRDPSMMDLLCAILHDRDEDLTETKIGSERWQAMRQAMGELFNQLDQNHRWFLGERIDILTHKKGLNYCTYLAELMGHSATMPDLIRVKLADRLDNTLDVGVSQHGIPGSGTFGTIFNLQFLPDYQGTPVPPAYVPISDDEGTQMLANLFKNAEFLSLLRSENVSLAGTTQRLYDTLLRASIRIAQYIVQDTFSLAISITEQRLAVFDVLTYCQSDGLRAVRVSGGHPLDGLFLDLYGDSEGRKCRLRQIFTHDKPYLARIGLVFLAVFSNFMADPTYTINGIGRGGIRAV